MFGEKASEQGTELSSSLTFGDVYLILHNLLRAYLEVEKNV